MPFYLEFANGLLDHQYVSIGIQYFLLARTGAAFIFNPSSGNLYHLSFELLLKAYLLKNGFSKEDLKEKGHNLNKLWNLFKGKFKFKNNEKYDLIINELNRWEDVRYIENNKDESIISIEIVDGNHQRCNKKMIKKGRFYLNTDDMDDLFNFFFTILKISNEELMKNPDFYNGLVLYRKNNKFDLLK